MQPLGGSGNLYRVVVVLRETVFQEFQGGSVNGGCRIAGSRSLCERSWSDGRLVARRKGKERIKKKPKSHQLVATRLCVSFLFFSSLLCRIPTTGPTSPHTYPQPPPQNQTPPPPLATTNRPPNQPSTQSKHRPVAHNHNGGPARVGPLLLGDLAPRRPRPPLQHLHQGQLRLAEPRFGPQELGHLVLGVVGFAL